MRTIEEILKRDDYRRMSSELSDKVMEIAKCVREKMTQLDIKELGYYFIATQKSNSGYTYKYLSVCNNSYDRIGSSLEDDHDYYFCGDFNCEVTAAPNKLKLKFLNSAKEIFEELDKIEDEQCNSIENAINKYNDGGINKEV